MKKSKIKSIKSKLIIVSVLLLTIPLVILGLFSYQKSEDSLNELGATNLKNSVEMTIGMIEALNHEVEKGNLTLENAQEEVKIAMLGEMHEDGTRPINKNIDLGENGYMFVLDDNGMQLAHPSLEGENSWDNEDPNGVKSTQEIIKTGNEGGGFTYFDWPLLGNENQIASKVAYSNKDPYWGWTVVSSTYMIDFNAPAKEILHVILIIAGISLFAGIFVIWIFANNISKPLNAVVKQMDYLANADLTKEQIQIKTNDETGQLASAMNHMHNNLKEIIANVSSASEKVSNQSEELTESASEVMSGSEQIASTMQELAGGAESQANHASELSSAMQEFSNKIKEVNQRSEHIHESSNKVLVTTDEGSQLMKSSISQMEKIDTIVQGGVRKMEGLDSQSQQISKLVDVIQGVADQTNLLALNAAIEAARAGEHGKGFAVVADEVRKLAEQVSESVMDISDIVTNIQNESSAVSDSLQAGYQEVERGTNQIHETSEKFKDIYKAISNITDSITLTYENMAEIAESSQQMNDSVQEIAAVSEEASAGIEQTSASSQQTSGAMEEVTASSNELAKLADELNALVRHFKL